MRQYGRSRGLAALRRQRLADPYEFEESLGLCDFFKELSGDRRHYH